MPRSTTWTNSIRPPARSCTLPQARIRPVSSRTTTFWRVRRPRSETSTSTSSCPAPAQPRPSRSWARSSSVSRSTSPGSSGSGVPTRQPDGRSSGGSPSSSGSGSNRLSSGIISAHPAAGPEMGNSPFGPLPWRSNTKEADRTVRYPKIRTPGGGGSGVLALVLRGPPGGGDGLELGAQPEHLLLDLDDPQLGDRGPLLGLD